MNIKKTIHKISSTITKAVLVMVVFFGVIALFTSIANKDKIRIDPEETTKNQRAEIYKVINDPQYQKNDAGKVAIGVYRAMLCGTIGEACTDNPADADENFNHSLFGFVSNLIVMPYANPPASGVQYIAYSLGNAGLIPKTYAAEGIGFASIKPMIEIWKAFRNVAYLILVLVLIAIGFMIMFRMKLNPQTVISLENALPKIVISLILITFSFAIAGLLIDLMYVGITVVISLLSDVKVGGEALIKNLPSVQDHFIGAGMTNLWPYDPRHTGSAWWDLLSGKTGNSIFGVGNAFVKALPDFLEGTLRTVSLLVGGLLNKYLFMQKEAILSFFKDAMDSPSQFVGFSLPFNYKAIPGAIGIVLASFSALMTPLFGPSFLLGILFFFTLLFLMFRLFFMLLMAYIKTIILIIMSPIVLIFDAIPGKNSFSFWFKSLVGELLTFPLVIFFILIGYLISTAHIVDSNFFRPPFLSGIDPGAFSAILGMGMLLVIPQAVKMSKELLGIKDIPAKAGFFSGATTVLGGGLGLLGTFSSINMGLGAFGLGAGNKGRGIFSGLFGKATQGARETAEGIANAGDMSGGKG